MGLPRDILLDESKNLVYISLLYSCMQWKPLFFKYFVLTENVKKDATIKWLSQKKSLSNSLEFTLLDSDENKSNFTYLHIYLC